MEIEYYRLRDIEHQNTIVKGENDGKCYEYVQNEGWVRSGIMTKYFCDESDYYDLFDEITEEEAMKIISEQHSS